MIVYGAGRSRSPVLLLASLAGAALSLLSTVQGAALAADPPRSARPGEIAAEPSTMNSLAVRWPILGDGNANARVEVAYRHPGEKTWRRGYPLFRVYPGHSLPGNRVAGGWLFAGSLVDLTPATEYEVRLRLHDPDGGSATRILTMRTAAEPGRPDSLRVLHARPLAEGETEGGSGSKRDPFRGLKAVAAGIGPGDAVELAPGRYTGMDIRLPSGTADRPVVLRGSPGTILDGAGAPLLIDLRSRRHVWLEGMALRGGAVLVDTSGGHGIVLRHNRFAVREYGVKGHGATYDESRHIVVSDNVFEGTVPWPPPRRSPSVYAVSLTGSGHVIRYNRIRGVRDGVFNGDNGSLSASDIHNNDIAACGDDGIETDYSDTNVRVYRNRIADCFVGISAQPARGGPVYIFRNFIYNSRYSPIKLHNHTAGVLIFHNTSVRSGFPFHIQPARETVNDVVSRNNIFVGTIGPALRTTGRMIRCDFDNDGYLWWSGPFAQWNGTIYASAAAARESGTIYAKRGAIGLGPARPFAAGLWTPKDPFRKSDPAALDPRLAANSRAVDRGVLLPGFNDAYEGRAPDLGCCERGGTVFHVGPRPMARRR